MEQITVNLDELHPDVENPRLSEQVERTESAVYQFFFDHGSLEELAQSFVDNGYFEAERMIIRARDEGGYTVVEGNRRLAALKILHGETIDEFPQLVDPPPSEQVLGQLREIPCLLVDDPRIVRRYLAYRHIGGLKTWSPEAKARFLKSMIDEVIAEGVAEDPFKAVGRRVGTNALGVRNPYLALSVLEYGREQLDVDTKYVQYERFGVWVRCMNSTEIRQHVGLNSPRSFAEVQAALASLSAAGLSEVIGDLTPSDGRKAVVVDSRDVTVYGRILANPLAHETLRKHGSLDVARQVVAIQSFPARVEQAAIEVEVLIDEVNRVESLPKLEDLDRFTERLAGAARTLRVAVRDRLADD